MARIHRAAGVTTARDSDGDADPRVWFGEIDIYLFDQIQRGRIPDGATVLDAGCGAGRNLEYFLRAGYDVYATDRDAAAIRRAHALAQRLAPLLPTDRFRQEDLTGLSLASGTVHFVICCAVLHFAVDDDHFDTMVRELWRVLRPGGILFTRLASSIGIEDRIQPLGNRRFRIPDGTDRFLVDEPFLLAKTEELAAQLLDPIKTVNVQGQRCMTTWCLRKPGGGPAQP